MKWNIHLSRFPKRPYCSRDRRLRPLSASVAFHSLFCSVADPGTAIDTRADPPLHAIPSPYPRPVTGRLVIPEPRPFCDLWSISSACHIISPPVRAPSIRLPSGDIPSGHVPSIACRADQPEKAKAKAKACGLCFAYRDPMKHPAGPSVFGRGSGGGGYIGRGEANGMRRGVVARIGHHIMLALATLLGALAFVGIVAAAPLKHTLGEMTRHRSPGWDDAHHTAHYRRWERIEVADALGKRDGEAAVVRRLFRDGGAALGKRADGLEFQMSMRLMPRDQAKVREVLHEVNDPSHSRFRIFLSHEEAMELLS